MKDKEKDRINQVAAQILSAMLSNPHIYTTISDELAQGQQEQKLVTIAIAMANSLITQIDEM